MEVARRTYDPRKTHLQTYLSLSSLFHCHRFPWKPGEAGSLCVRACASACTRVKEREKERIREFAGKKEPRIIFLTPGCSH